LYARQRGGLGWGTGQQPGDAITFAGWRSQLDFRTAIGGGRRSIVIALPMMMLQLDLIAT